ncbi:MAG: hypothetical protein ACE5H5_05320, partial [Nitrospinota bacterium]
MITQRGDKGHLKLLRSPSRGIRRRGTPQSAIGRGIVEVHRGTLRAENVPGSRAFVVRWGEEVRGQMGTGKILVVDDE